MRLAQGGEAGKEGIDEDWPSRAVERYVVGIDVARRPATLWNVESVVGSGREFTGSQSILESPELEQARHPQCLAVGADCQTHAAFECALENGEASVWLDSDHE